MKSIERLPYIILLIAAFILFAGNVMLLWAMHRMRKNPIVKRLALLPFSIVGAGAVLLVLITMIVLTGERPDILIYLLAIPYAAIGIAGGYLYTYFRGLENGEGE